MQGFSKTRKKTRILKNKEKDKDSQKQGLYNARILKNKEKDRCLWVFWGLKREKPMKNGFPKGGTHFFELFMGLKRIKGNFSGKIEKGKC